MPSKFNCRQLREMGQRFEDFLVAEGLDMETDRERLRTIYNRDFKTRYGIGPLPGPESPAPLAATTPSAGPPFPPQGAEGRSSPSGSGRSRGGSAPLPRSAHAPPAPPAPPAARRLCPGRAPAPSPREDPPLQPSPRAARDPAGKRGAAPTRRLRGLGRGDSARRGGGELERGPGLRGSAGSKLMAPALRGPPPPC